MMFSIKMASETLELVLCYTLHSAPNSKMVSMMRIGVHVLFYSILFMLYIEQYLRSTATYAAALGITKLYLWTEDLTFRQLCPTEKLHTKQIPTINTQIQIVLNQT